MGQDTAPRTLPPLGEDPGQIAAYLNDRLWAGYTEMRRPWLRQVEENVRNLAGRQFDSYVPELDQFVDLSSVYLPGDERWRRAPVFNWLGQHWFVLHLAKLTENIPVLGAMPSTGDTRDAQTAALFDPFFKYQWNQMRMPEQQFKLFGWVLAAGETTCYLRWDTTKGDPRDYYGADTLPLGQQNPTSQSPWVQPTRRERLGDFTCDVLCPTSVLWPYGPWPHWAAPFVMREYLLHVDEARARFGVPDLEPDGDLVGNDLLARMEYTSYYGNSGSPGSLSWSSWGSQWNTALRDMVRLREYWGRETPTNPYGRLTVASKAKLLFDDINPFVIPGQREKVIIPFFRFQKPGYPFRQEGLSDCEGLNPVQRALNRSAAGMLDYADYNEQPPLVYNANLVPDDQVEKLSAVGARIGVTGDPNGAVSYVQVPPMPPAVLQNFGMLREMLDVLGHAGSGSSGNAVTNDASGELQREVRFDADRPDGATLRLASYEWARFGETLIDMAAVCMEDERILAIAGEDQALDFVTVRPDLFMGRVNVYPLPESAVIETRQDKQMRLKDALMTAAELSAANPEMATLFLKQMGYPNLHSALKQGSEAERLAERQIVEMCQTGQLAPVLPEQDHGAHMAVTSRYMQTLAYRNQPEPVKQVLRTYRLLHEMAGMNEMIGQAEKQGMATEVMSAAAGIVDPRAVQNAQAEQAMHPPEPKLKRVK